MSKNKKAISEEGYGSGKQVKIELVGTRVANQRLDPTGDPPRNPTRGGRGRAGQAFYSSSLFKAGLLVFRNSG